jgi:Protein of unknown function (DUF3761)
MGIRRVLILATALVTLAGCGPVDSPAGGTAPAVVVTATPTPSTTPSTTSSPTPSPSPEPTTGAPTPAAAPTTAAAIVGGGTGGGSGGGAGSCPVDYYRNSSGNCVHRPAPAPTHPAGATALCNDGTYSYSQHRQGTCSHHGGVRIWF